VQGERSRLRACESCTFLRDGEVLCEIPVRHLNQPQSWHQTFWTGLQTPSSDENPVRNVLGLKRHGRGSRRELPRPAQIFFGHKINRLSLT
jgi:hypothetical protein